MRRATELSCAPGTSVITNALGEFAILPTADARDLLAGRLSNTHSKYSDLEARGLLTAAGPFGGLSDMAQRTRKAFLMEGPSLHIFVVTLRCDHACQYCQVSRADIKATQYDMDRSHARSALDRVFESDAPFLTIEFQGGEPSLRFDLVRDIVGWAKARAEAGGRSVRFTMATTLHRLTDEDLAFCKEHEIHLSTSVDGPSALHDRQRPTPGGNAWSKTIAQLERARSIVGENGVVALPTITRAALAMPEALVDTYVELAFRSIFLRPLAPYGFAKKSQKSLGYSTEEFLTFYERALRHIFALNQRGVPIEETTASIALRHMLSPFHSGYMDLRSPSAAGLGVLVYNYDGRVFPSDEARMAAEMGDERFALGTVDQALDTLLGSPAMVWLSRGAVAETHADCSSCAFVPYCGADPVFHAIGQGEPDAPRIGSPFCDRQMFIFQLLFAEIKRADPETMRTFNAWAFSLDRAEVKASWIEQ